MVDPFESLGPHTEQGIFGNLDWRLRWIRGGLVVCLFLDVHCHVCSGRFDRLCALPANQVGTRWGMCADEGGGHWRGVRRFQSCFEGCVQHATAEPAAPVLWASGGSANSLEAMRSRRCGFRSSIAPRYWETTTKRCGSVSRKASLATRSAHAGQRRRASGGANSPQNPHTYPKNSVMENVIPGTASLSLRSSVINGAAKLCARATYCAS